MAVLSTDLLSLLDVLDVLSPTAQRLHSSHACHVIVMVLYVLCKTCGELSYSGLLRRNESINDSESIIQSLTTLIVYYLTAQALYDVGQFTIIILGGVYIRSAFSEDSIPQKP